MQNPNSTTARLQQTQTYQPSYHLQIQNRRKVSNEFENYNHQTKDQKTFAKRLSEQKQISASRRYNNTQTVTYASCNQVKQPSQNKRDSDFNSKIGYFNDKTQLVNNNSQLQLSQNIIYEGLQTIQQSSHPSTPQHCHIAASMGAPLIGQIPSRVTPKHKETTVSIETDFLTHVDEIKSTISSSSHTKHKRTEHKIQSQQQFTPKQMATYSHSKAQNYTRKTSPYTGTPTSQLFATRYSPYSRMNNDLLTSVMARNTKSRSISPLSRQRTIANSSSKHSPKPVINTRRVGFNRNQETTQSVVNPNLNRKSSPISGGKYSPKPQFNRYPNNSTSYFPSQRSPFQQISPLNTNKSKSPVSQKQASSFLRQGSRSPSSNWIPFAKSQTPHHSGFALKKNSLNSHSQATRKTQNKQRTQVMFPQLPAVVRVLNTVDYSLVNELSRVERPSNTVLMIGQMLCEFLHFIRSPTTFVEELSLQNEQNQIWSEICHIVKRSIINSLFEFKDRVKAIASNPNTVPESSKNYLRHMKQLYFQNKSQLKLQLRNIRVIRILTQLAWVTICTVLELKDEINEFDVCSGDNKINQIRYNLGNSRSRSRKLSRSISPNVINKKPSVTFNPALTRSVLESKRSLEMYVNLKGIQHRAELKHQKMISQVPVKIEQQFDQESYWNSTERTIEQSHSRHFILQSQAQSQSFVNEYDGDVRQFSTSCENTVVKSARVDQFTEQLMESDFKVDKQEFQKQVIEAKQMEVAATEVINRLEELKQQIEKTEMQKFGGIK